MHLLGFQFERFIVLLYLFLDWKQLGTIDFVLIHIRIGVGYMLQLAFVGRVTICYSKLV